MPDAHSRPSLTTICDFIIWLKSSELVMWLFQFLHRQEPVQCEMIRRLIVIERPVWTVRTIQPLSIWRDSFALAGLVDQCHRKNKKTVDCYLAGLWNDLTGDPYREKKRDESHISSTSPIENPIDSEHEHRWLQMLSRNWDQWHPSYADMDRLIWRCRKWCEIPCLTYMPTPAKGPAEKLRNAYWCSWLKSQGRISSYNIAGSMSNHEIWK